MMHYEYKRIKDDHREGTIDSLETMCTEEGKAGWRVIAISDGSQFRYATLEREIDDGRSNSKEDSIGGGLPTVNTKITRRVQGAKS